MIWQKEIGFGVIIFLISVFLANGFSQKFIIDNEKGEFKQKFELVNDLVIVPVEVNGRELAFLLDTGVNSTILFSLTSKDSSSVKSPRVVYLQGIGVEAPIRALKSNHNQVRLGDAISRDHEIYIIEAEVLDISNRLGYALNGILGYEFFRDFVVEFNYKRRLMKVYKADSYRYDSCRRCIDIPLKFHRNKPYLSATVSISGKEEEVVLLVDSGSGDAVWLFEREHNGIFLPENSFSDYLGFGISGSVYGERSRIDMLSIGKYTLKDVTASFPDSLALEVVSRFEERDGSIGAQVLKRFHLVVDYEGKNLRLRPNNDFHDPFEYNMSGVVIKHSGYKLVKNQAPPNSFKIEDDNTEGVEVYNTQRQVIYSLEPGYEIAEIRPDSPAEISGLKIGDEIVKLNGRPVYRYDLSRIFDIFSSKEGKRIRLQVLRNGELLEFSFRLERIL